MLKQKTSGAKTMQSSPECTGSEKKCYTILQMLNVRMYQNAQDSGEQNKRSTIDKPLLIHYFEY